MICTCETLHIPSKDSNTKFLEKLCVLNLPEKLRSGNQTEENIQNRMARSLGSQREMWEGKVRTNGKTLKTKQRVVHSGVDVDTSWSKCGRNAEVLRLRFAPSFPHVIQLVLWHCVRVSFKHRNCASSLLVSKLDLGPGIPRDAAPRRPTRQYAPRLNERSYLF